MLTTFQKSLLAVLGGGVLVLALVISAKTSAAAPFTPLAALPPNVANPIPPGVVTVGDGSVKARPDLAVVSIGAVAQASTAEDAQSQVADRIGRILDRAKGLGIAEKDIANAGYGVQPQYAYGPNQAPRLTGFQATQQLSLNVRDVQGVGKVLDALVGMGVTNASVRFTLADSKPSQGDARRLAIEDARAKAEAMARAAGVKLGKAISVSEVGATTPIPYRGADFAPAPAASRPTEIPVSDLDVVVRVQVQFAIED